MSKYYIYTGENFEEAEQKAQTNLDITNQNFLEKAGSGIFCDAVEILTANPVIEEHVYYCGFQEPPECIREGVEYDLCREYDSAWKLPDNPE